MVDNIPQFVEYEPLNFEEAEDYTRREQQG